MNNNYQNQMVAYLNQFLSNVAVFTNKMYNYHWNVVGPHFFSLHAKLQEYYEKGNEEFDLVAERIKQLEGFPITSLSKYSSISSIKEAESRNYKENEIIASIIGDMKLLHRIASDIASYASNGGDGVTGSILGEFINYLEKQLWMLEANLK